MLLDQKTRNWLYLSIIIIALFMITGCGTAPKLRETQRQRAKGLYVGPRFVEAPVYRVGLTELATSVVTVRAKGGLALLDRRGALIDASRSYPQISFFVKGATGAGPTTTFRIQVASFASKSNATRLASRIKREMGMPVVVRFSSQTRTYRVQVGEAASRSEVTKLEDRLRQAGYTDMFVVSERNPGVAGVDGSGLTAVDASGNRIARSQVFRVVPENKGALLQVNDSAYRGALELRVNGEGFVLPVNIVNLEEYLRGVVPAEMSSSQYPQIEALKAQALAARTYAWANRNQYAAQGFDICSTASCQVYKGASVEQDLTDRAIRETSSEIITYDGKPVNALFTSTCGGHTENVENIFQGNPLPYLRGVYCAPEAESFSRLASTDDANVTYGADGLPIDFDLAILKKLDILSAGFDLSPSVTVSWKSLADTVKATIRFLGRKTSNNGESGGSALTLSRAVDFIIASAGWQQRVDRHVLPFDLGPLAGLWQEEDLDLTSKKNLLYFLRLGFISTEPDGSLAVSSPLTQTRLVRMLSRLLAYESPAFIQGLFMTRSEGGITIQSGTETRTIPVAVNMRLFRRFEHIIVPMRTMQMVPGDTVMMVLKSGISVILVHTPPFKGVASDRFSRFFQWEVKYTCDELKDKLKRYVDVGSIKDLKPLRYGASERIVELQVVGDRGVAVLEGLRIRWGLGLRENLFVIDRIYDEYGKVTMWRFIGRGWGHGVGLCQVGAYGMSLAGKNYEEIVKHYYSGVTIAHIKP